MNKEGRIERAKKYSEYKKERDARNEGRRKAKEYYEQYNATEGQKKYADILGTLEEYLDEEEYAALMDRIGGIDHSITSDEVLDLYDKVYIRNNKIADAIASIDIPNFNQEMEEKGSPVRIKTFIEEPVIDSGVQDLSSAISSLYPELKQKEFKPKTKFEVNEWGF